MSKIKGLMLMVFFGGATTTACKSTAETASGTTEPKQTENAAKCKNAESAKFVDLSDLDGCTWMLELENEKRVMPLNLRDFDIEPSDEMKVNVVFIRKDVPTTCMAGHTVEISCIETAK